MKSYTVYLMVNHNEYDWPRLDNSLNSKEYKKVFEGTEQQCFDYIFNNIV